MLEDNGDQKLNAPEAARFISVAVSTLAKMRCLCGSPAVFKAGRKAWLSARVWNTTEATRLPRRITDRLHLDDSRPSRTPRMIARPQLSAKRCIRYLPR